MDQPPFGLIAPLEDASFALIVVLQLVKDKPIEANNSHSAQPTDSGFGGRLDWEHY
ncbi:hypothetical protein [Synechococcus sp. CC9311]|uniref:hypothetical protein n=1 Tax=Synechococcus sp. (strain CC9311) TaxID=64471 RepID=UPI00030F9099|nr:hypothetical protein [Synechococcus sp. CC9311]